MKTILTVLAVASIALTGCEAGTDTTDTDMGTESVTTPAGDTDMGSDTGTGMNSGTTMDTGTGMTTGTM